MVLKSTGGTIICLSNQQSDAKLLSASLSSLYISLAPSIDQLSVAEMLEVPGELSSVPAIQTATLHLSTVPGLWKSATGKARDTRSFTHLDRVKK